MAHVIFRARRGVRLAATKEELYGSGIQPTIDDDTDRWSGIDNSRTRLAGIFGARAVIRGWNRAIWFTKLFSGWLEAVRYSGSKDPLIYWSYPRPRCIILIDGARGDWAPRRLRCVPLDCDQLSLKDGSFGLSPLQDALNRLERHETGLYRIVNLRFFEGFRIGEIASALAISPATVDRKIRASLDFLRGELLKGSPSAGPMEFDRSRRPSRSERQNQGIQD